MTTYPQGNQQYSPTPQPRDPRPGSVTALAIIGIVFGGGGLLCKPLSVAFLFLPQPQPNPAVDLQKEMMGWNLVNGGIGLLISGLLLAAAIASLKLVPWGRKGMLAYAALAVLMNVVGLVVSLVWLVPKTNRLYEQLKQQGQGVPPGMVSILQKAGVPLTIVTFVVLMIFPLVLWYFFTRREVKAAFEGGGGMPGGPYGGQPGAYPAATVPGAYAPTGAYPPPQ